MEKYKFDALDGLRASEEKASEESLDELIFDIHDELAEAVKAAKAFKRKPIRSNRLHLACELADTQFTCETAMESLGFNKPERDAIRKDVASGNEQAGYYNLNRKMYSLFCMHDASGVVVWKGTYKTHDEMLDALNTYVQSDKVNGLSGHSYYLGECYKCQKVYDAECGF